MANVIMVVGGSRSGKSLFAEKLAKEQQEQQQQQQQLQGDFTVTYIATGTIFDEDFSERVRKHRERRPVDWETIEEPTELHKALESIHEQSQSITLIDGIGTWIANMMYKEVATNKEVEMNMEVETSKEFIWNEDKEKDCLWHIDLFIQATKEWEGTIILVADEVGMDVIPEHREARIFRDLNGLANQLLAELADRVYLVVCGLPIVMKEA